MRADASPSPIEPGGQPVADARRAERALVIGYVPPPARAGFAALLALDDVLAGIVRTTREPIVGQMRLTWWFDALEALDEGASPVGEPVLTALARDWRPHGGTGAMLAGMIDGWEALLSPEPLDPAAMRLFARARGGAMFAAFAAVLGGTVDATVMAAGEGWALADLAANLRDPAQAAAARATAIDSLKTGLGHAWPRALRPIGMLALLARADVTDTSSRPGSPRRLVRMLMHRIWGR